MRWGGEEFIIFMPKTDEKKAYDRLLRILYAIRDEKIKVDDHLITCTVTIGLSLSDDLNAYEKVINDADQKLYKGKNSGKDKIVCDF